MFLQKQVVQTADISLFHYQKRTFAQQIQALGENWGHYYLDYQGMKRIIQQNTAHNVPDHSELRMLFEQAQDSTSLFEYRFKTNLSLFLNQGSDPDSWSNFFLSYPITTALQKEIAKVSTWYSAKQKNAQIKWNSLKQNLEKLSGWRKQ